jgi:hypothetical protein
MAGILKCDQVQSDSNLAFSIAGSNVAFMNATSLQMVGSNVSLAGTNVITNGKVVTAAQPVGAVLQVVQATTNTPLSATNQDVNTFNFECAITPLFSTSKMLVIASVNGIDNGGSGRFSTYIYQGTTSGGTSGTERINVQVAQDSTSTAGLQSTSISYLSSAIGSTTTQYFKILNSKNDGGSTWFVQRFNIYSSLVVMEIAA